MATNKVVVVGSSVTAGQMKDFWRQVDDGSISSHTLQAFLDHQNPFADRDALPDLDFAKVYEVLGMSAEYAEFVKANEAALANKSGLWTVVALKGVTPNKVIAAFRKLEVGLSLYSDNLDTEVTKNDRDPNRDGSYVVRFKKTIEADEELKNLSADDLKKQNVKGNTLLERLLLELGYFLVTGQHLDVKNWTLCAGSRGSDGSVPDVRWNSDGRELSVSWYCPVHRSPRLRTRAAVS